MRQLLIVSGQYLFQLLWQFANDRHIHGLMSFQKLVLITTTTTKNQRAARADKDEANDCLKNY